MPPNNMKKAQIQMGETIMVLVILVIIGIFALTYYAGNAKQELLEKLKEVEQETSIETAQTLSNLPEIKCSGDIKLFCFDKYKAEALKETINEDENASEYYRELLKKAKITLKTIYPEEQEIIIYDNPYKKQEGQESTKITSPLVIPVPIYDPLNDRKEFGLLIIEKYYKPLGT